MSVLIVAMTLAVGILIGVVILGYCLWAYMGWRNYGKATSLYAVKPNPDEHTDAR